MQDYTVMAGSMPENVSGSDEGSREDNIFWYLGIDLGTTGMSAVLLNYSSRSVYPIYWLEIGQEGSADGKYFRLPSVAYISRGSVENNLTSKSVVVGPSALLEAEGSRAENGVLLQNIKPYLQVTITDDAPEKIEVQPVLRWSEGQEISLSWVQLAVQSLLASISQMGSENELDAPINEEKEKELLIEEKKRLVIAAEGLASKRLKKAIAHLSGVIMCDRANWSETYRFNLREAVLGAKLVSDPGQVMFLEEAICSLLSELPDTAAGSQWRGWTVVINSGASTTELTLVDLPYGNSRQLRHQDFQLRSFDYGGNAIDQDIICQLLLTPDRDMDMHLLDGDIKKPVPGDPDLSTRYRLQQRLQDSDWGRNLLEACKQIKQVLQRQNSFTLELGNRQWVVLRRDLEMQVQLPFLRRLNREFNAMLAETGVPVEAINQALCTGGAAAIPAIARWLRQKLPSAAIIQDTYPATRSPVCSRVAYGLATLPLFPQVLDLPRQQYNDYFLLLELLRYEFPDRPLSSEEILQLLELHGINTRVCQQQIIAFLEGHLPAGLVPHERDMVLLTPDEELNSYYHSLTESPLFYKEADQLYRLNFTQRDRLRQHLDMILANSYQTLEEPYAVEINKC